MVKHCGNLSSSQDKTLWEDLGQLEGCLGMRYLTHETEDAFWMSHGAKSHPLAKAEAEKRKQQQQEALETRPNQRVNFAEPDLISNSSKVSDGSSRSVESTPGVFTEPTSTGSDPNGSIDVERNGDTPTIQQNYLSMSDEQIVKAQKHAERVGYKVTTV